jgi:Na+/pantothenate symporter
MSVTLFVIYGLLGVFLFFHNKWWTQPYRYPDFLGKYDTAETMVLVLGGFVLLSGVSVLVGGIFEASTKLVSQAFNLSLQTMGPTPVRKRLTQFFGLTFLLVVLPGILALPIIG